MKKTALALILISTLLITAIAGTLLVSLGRAQPYQDLGTVPPDPLTKPSRVTIFSPINASVFAATLLTLSVNVTLPESSTAWGTILYYVICQTDWQENGTYLYQNLGYENSVESQIPGAKHQYFQGSEDFTDIPYGNHSVTVTAVAGGWYHAGNSGFYRFYINGSSTVFFVTDSLPPTIEILTVGNETYGTNDLILNFSVNEQTSQLMYSLDGKSNVTITGNTTLTGLAYGNHHLTVYAKDEAGNVGASSTINFNIVEPFPTTFIIPSVIVIIVVAIGLFDYFKKLRRKT